jgi:hypothetical protein
MINDGTCTEGNISATSFYKGCRLKVIVKALNESDGSWATCKQKSWPEVWGMNCSGCEMVVIVSVENRFKKARFTDV